MLSYSTCFPVSPKSTIDELILLGKKWRLGSQHSTINKEIERDFSLTEECRISNSTESLHFQKYEYEGENIGGIRHSFTENDSIRWVTEVVGHKTPNSYWISVKVFKESEMPLLDDHQSHKPYIVKLIMQEMGIGYDGSMPVGDKPIFLKNSEAHIAQKAIEDKLGCIMPTVYVSAPNNGQHNINSKGLAKRLSGMAHILVEPDADFSFDLKEKVRDINAYNGAVGIYWPGTMNRLFFVQRGKSPNTRKIENDVCQKVKDSLLTHRGIQECSWPFLLEIKSKLKMRELRETGSTKLDKYMELFDAELDAKKEELALAQKEIERLSRQVYSNTMTTPIPGTPILIRGSEEDKYKGECIDLLLDILNREVRNCEVGTRRRDIIEDLIASNSGNGEKKVILAQLKSLLHSYKKIDAKTRAGLEEIGFHLRENGGKHYKLNFRNEHRYTVVVSKTSSDHRTGRNTVQAISKKML